MSVAGVARVWEDICVPPVRGQGRSVQDAQVAAAQEASRVIAGVESAEGTERSPKIRVAAAVGTAYYAANQLPPSVPASVNGSDEPQVVILDAGHGGSC